jgi:acyl-CoA synthetase (AMP-forming)/AMP-acid ligase II
MLLDDPAFAAAPLAGLRLIACGGAPTPPELLARCARLLPWTRLVIAYGSTETGHLLACPPEEHQARPGALGRPGPRVALAVCDAAGQPAAPGTVGEITSSGAHLMDGYLDDPGEDAAYFRSGDRRGWTGDLGRVDPDGVVVMAGRRKEMILCGGMNVFPAELELPLAGYPGIAECAAFGLPDPQWGELPALAVVPRPGAVLDPEALLAFCAERLARFKRPRRVVLVASLPRTAAGKVRRNLLAANCHAALTRNPPAHGEPGKESNA